jgi:hypothetical protein
MSETIIQRLEQKWAEVNRTRQLNSLSGNWHGHDFMNGECSAFREAVHIIRQHQAELQKDAVTGNKNILTIKLPVPVPAIKTIPRWRVFLALFNPRAHFTTCTELKHQLCRETEATARFHADNLRNIPGFSK